LEKELADLKAQVKELEGYRIEPIFKISIEEMSWLDAVESATIFLIQQEAIEPLPFQPYHLIPESQADAPVMAEACYECDPRLDRTMCSSTLFICFEKPVRHLTAHPTCL
jgi:hypothetical protein